MRKHLRSAGLGTSLLMLVACSGAVGSEASPPGGGVAGAFLPPAGGPIGSATLRYLLEGNVRVGAGIVSNNAGGLVGNNSGNLVSDGGSGLSGSNPLSIVTPLARVTDVSAATRVAPVTALTSVTPVTALAQGFRVQVASATIVVEIVDPASGGLLERANADAQGHYRFELAEPLDNRGWIVQATEVSAATVSAFLAAPVPTRASRTEKEVVDISPASTIVVFTAALVSGIRDELRVDTGFRGVKTEQLATLVSRLDGDAVKQAAAKIDKADGLNERAKFDVLLDKVVDSSAALAKASEKLAAGSGQKLAHVVAAGNEILREIAKDAETIADPAADVAKVAEKVEPAAVKREAETIVKAAPEQAKLLETYVITGSLN